MLDLELPYTTWVQTTKQHTQPGQIQVLQHDMDGTMEPDHSTEGDQLSDPMLGKLRVAAEADPDYRYLDAAISSGFPTHSFHDTFEMVVL